MLGILLIDKPEGESSHDQVRTLRKKLGTKRIGHAGTLDPNATGLLVMAVGPATRFLSYLPLEPKVYEATFRFGIITKTYDLESEPEEERLIPADLEGQIAKRMPELIGDIEQRPPLYSAIKKDGRKLYEYARRGEEVEIEPRQTTVHSIEPLGGEGNERNFRITCAGGTYIRSLAHDLGQMVGCGAVTSAIRRSVVGRFSVEESVAPGDAAAEHLIPLHHALSPTFQFELNEGQVEHIRHGRPIRFGSELPLETIALRHPDGHIIGIAETDGVMAKPTLVMPPEHFDA